MIRFFRILVVVMVLVIFLCNDQIKPDRVLAIEAENQNFSEKIILRNNDVSQCEKYALGFISIDGVNIELCLPFFPDSVSVAKPDDFVQSGSWIKQNPYQEFSIYAVPYGIFPSADNLPKATLGISENYKLTTLEFYQPYANKIYDSPLISIFSASAKGTTYILPNQFADNSLSEMMITEWITEAGNRVWIIRSIIYGEFDDEFFIDRKLNELNSIVIYSNNLESPSTSLEQHNRIHIPPVTTEEEITASDLPTPSWWNGDCDKNRYLSVTGVSSYRLGAVYRNLVACGPGGVGTGTYQYGLPTSFGDGTQQLEFQCAELPKRFLKLLYGLAPRSADGINVVNVYDNALPNLKKVANGTANSGFAPGDILSYNGPTAAGHTAVVTSVTWNDSNGNGSYSTIEQNSSSSGARTNTITNWWINSNSGISYFLHDTNSSSSCPGPSLSSPSDGYVSSSQTINFSWSAPSGCTFEGYQFRIKDTSNMDSGGNTFQDTGNSSTSRTETLGTEWNNKDLYWGVRTANPLSPNWSVRRFRIEPGSSCSPNSDQAALYTGTNYSGSCVVKNIGNYSNPGSIGIANDSVSSVKVGGNVKLTLCEHDDYLGTCEVFTGDDSNLGDNAIRIGTSSAKVENRNSQPCYTLTRSHAGSGSDPTASPTNSTGCSSGQYHSGEYITLTASPSSGYQVGSWTGTDNNSSTSTTNYVTMPASARTVTVNYIQPCYTLSRTHTGSGSDPSASPTNSTGCSSGQYHSGEYITLTASPLSGYHVASWTGTDNNSSTSTTNYLTMPASARTVTVNFVADTLPCYVLSRTHTGSGSDPTANPTNSTGCASGQYHSGEYITLTASPSSGYHVGGWTGTDNNSSTSMTNYVTMPASVRTVTVNFIPNSTSSQILVVDEDNNDPDVLTYYTDALTALGKTYTVWNANNSDIEPYPSNLLNYETVIWFTGSDYGDYAGPSSFGETSLGSWLDNNGCFLLSSQDYLYAQELTVFGSTYLGINEYSDDVGQTVATGAGNVFGGLGPFTLNYPFTDYSDFVTPDGTSQIAFTGNNGSSAVFKNSGTYKTVFLGFPFEAIPTAADRQAVMSRFLNWCDQTTTTPVITSMNPISKQTQSGGFTLTVYGNNLTSDSHIYWNGTQLDTYYYGNRVLALINSSQLLHADIVEITVDDSASKPFYIYTFADVTQTHPLWRYVEGFFAREITTGCAVNPMRYCPDRAVTRGEMAVFLLRSMHVDDVTPYEPADDPADPFADVPTPGKDWMEPWIEQFYATGITTGCGVNPLRYCPERNVSRGEMAVFLLRAKHGSSYTPPPATGTFADVPTSNWMAAWIEQFYKEGITTGCAVSPLRYCPDRSVNRAEMATFVDRAFGFPALP